ncbi:MAG: DUF188 domain-containing protein [Syntrophotaleaceae bacterium]
MQIWIDADACPRPTGENSVPGRRAGESFLILVANKPMPTPASRYIRTMIVASGMDVADATIVDLLQPGDLVITADIPSPRWW